MYIIGCNVQSSCCKDTDNEIKKNYKIMSVPKSVQPPTPSTLSELSVNDDDDVVEILDAKDVKSPLDDATVDDVVIEQGGSFLIQKTRGDNEPEHSALKEIKGLPILDIKVGALRAFCVKIGF